MDDQDINTPTSAAMLRQKFLQWLDRGHGLGEGIYKVALSSPLNFVYSMIWVYDIMNEFVMSLVWV